MLILSEGSNHLGPSRTDICGHPAQPNHAEHWASRKPGHPKYILNDWILGDGTNKLQNDNRYYLGNHLILKQT